MWSGSMCPDIARCGMHRAPYVNHETTVNRHFLCRHRSQPALRDSSFTHCPCNVVLGWRVGGREASAHSC